MRKFLIFNFEFLKRYWPSQKGFIKFTKRTLVSYLIISIVFFGTGLIYLFNPFGTRSVDAAWFNDNWGYRKAVPISSHTAAETAKYISVTISGTDTLVTNGQLQSDCGDMRFTKQNGDLMPYYIVSGCNSSSTVVHVYFDSFPAGAQTIYFYYGNSLVSNGFSSTDFASEAASYVVGTVGSEEKGPAPLSYWKFDDAQGTNVDDATTTNNDLTVAGSTLPTWQTENQCISGKCLYYSGSSSGSGSNTSTATLTPYAQLTTGTISFWSKITAANAQQTMFFFGRTTDTNNTHVQLYYDNRTSGGNNFQVTLVQDNTTYWSFTVSSSQFNSINETNKWHFYSLVHDGTTPSLYIDGKPMTATFTTSTNLTKWLKALATDATFPANGIRVMQSRVNSGTFTPATGFLDELKIYPQNRTASQAATDFNARSNPEGVATALGANTQNLPDALSDGLVGYWKMDQTSWSGSASEIIDSSGNANNGTALNGATTTSSGKYNYAGSLDGTDDSLNLGSGTTIDDLPAGNFTVDFWNYLQDRANIAGNDYVTMMGKVQDTGGCGTSNGWDISTNNSNLFLQLGVTFNGTNASYISGTNALTKDVWQKITMVWDAPTKTAKFYVNGKEVSSYLTQTPGVGTYQSDAAGSFRYSGTECSALVEKGRPDELRIYNRALTSAEVSQLYNWAPGPVGYWKMDESRWSGVSGEAKDNSGNAYNGTRGGDAQVTNIAKYGKAGTFDGTGDYVSIGNVLDLERTQAFSISAWVKTPTSAPTAAMNIVAKASTATNVPGYVLSLRGDQANDPYTFTLRGATSGQFADISFPRPANDQWQHVEITYTGNSLVSGITAYVNGVPQTKTTGTDNLASNITNTGSFNIGSRSDGTGSFNGQIDDVKIYQYTRTQAQVIEDMNANHPAPGSPVGTPLGSWKFDEGYSTTANNVGNAGNSGTTYTGTLTNMSAPATSTSGWTNNGKFGKALLFDGTNDRVDYGDMTVLEGANQATWSIWVNPTSLATSQGIAVKANNAATGQSWAIMTDSSTSSAVRVRIATGDTDQSTYGVTPSGVLTNGKWTHIMAVFDGTASGNSDRLKVYINGQPQTLSFTGTIPSTLNATTSIMRVSGWSDSGGSYFNGAMDEYRIYTEPLTADQAKLEMNRSQSEVLGALSDSSTVGNDNTSTRTAQSSASLYCIPGDSSTCTKPVGEWNLDEGSGTNAQDSSGTNNTGTITAGTGSYMNGKINKAYSFDGANTAINAGSASSLDDLPSAGLTAEAWIFPRTAGEGTLGRIFDKTTALGPTNGWFLTLDTAFTVNLSADYTGTDISRDSAVGAAPKNQWTHVAVTWNGSGGATAASNIKIYINGKETVYSASINGSGSRNSDAAASLRIGNDATSARTFDGLIDQAKVFNYVRTPAQIAWDYNQGKPIGHWKMDECQGTVINDISGNNNPGTLTIGASGTYTTPGTCNASSASSAWFNGVTGKKNYSMAFDGTDDLINVPANSIFNITTDITLSAWIKRNSLSAKGGFIVKTNGTTTWDYDFGIDEAGFNDLLFFYSDTAPGSTLHSTIAISDTNWHHVIFTRSGSTGTFYIDGKPAGSGTHSGSFNANSIPVKIGVEDTGNNIYFSGQMDDAKIFNYSLTASQVRSLYNDGAILYGPVTGAP